MMEKPKAPPTIPPTTMPTFESWPWGLGVSGFKELEVDSGGNDMSVVDGRSGEARKPVGDSLENVKMSPSLSASLLREGVYMPPFCSLLGLFMKGYAALRS